MKLGLSMGLLLLAAWTFVRPESHLHPKPNDASQPSANGPLVEARQALLRLPALAAQVDLLVDFLDQQTSWRGQYVQAAHGVPNFRWDLEMPDLNGKPARIRQVFDGRFHYVKTEFANESKLVYADLGSVNSLNQRNANRIASPAAWFGVGGLPSLLEHLAVSFEWEDRGEQRTAGSPPLTFRVLRGTWSVTALRELLREEINESWFEGGIQWDRLPRQLPHTVEIWIGSDSYLPGFPYRIVFFQQQRGRLGGWVSKPCITLTLHHIRLLESLDDNVFRIGTDGLQPVDLTGDYRARSKMYLLYPAQPHPR